jgi:hypothetical protein
MTTTYAYHDAAFYRNRQALLVYPLIALPFLAILFWLLGGGRGERYLTAEAAAGRPGAAGFNASIPNAQGGTIDGRPVENPGYGRAQLGQVLSRFTNTRREDGADTVQHLKALPVTSAPASSLAAIPGPATTPTSTRASRPGSKPNAAALAATGHRRASKGYYYQPPGGGTGYYTASDRQLDRQLQQYENSRTVSAAPLPARTQPNTAVPISTEETRTASVRLSDNLTASRLADPAESESPFVTAHTGGSRPTPTRAVLSGSGYGKKSVAWLIPVVVHEDQVVKEGQAVKLRLTKEISADGITIPANTILYATCRLDDDRLRLTVRNLQLAGQLIPLDLDVYDTDGTPGINVPGLSQQSQVGGQVRSSAVQGINVPALGGVGNAVLNSARLGASQSLRQTTIRLRGGYNLFLKA